MRTPRIAIALLAVGALSVAGCGSDDDTDVAGTSQTSAQTAPATTTPPATPAGTTTAAAADSDDNDAGASAAAPTATTPAQVAATNPARGSDRGFETYMKSNNATAAKLIEDAGLRDDTVNVTIGSGATAKKVFDFCATAGKWLTSTKRANSVLLFDDGKQVGSCAPR